MSTSDLDESLSLFRSSMYVEKYCASRAFSPHPDDVKYASTGFPRCLALGGITGWLSDSIHR